MNQGKVTYKRPIYQVLLERLEEPRMVPELERTCGPCWRGGFWAQRTVCNDG